MPRTITIDPNDSAFSVILKWATDSKLPIWQMDALRRLITQEIVTQVDVSELENIARNEHNILPEGTKVPTAVPLQADHIPTTNNANAGINLTSISELKHVNRIPSDQTLTFDPKIGLNVIYGKNGTGKTGYARVIKKACRTRGQTPTIRADVFAPKQNSPASAKIELMSGTNSTYLEWVDGKPSHPDLSQIFVFDSTSASHYLSNDDAASFTPFGLDVLPELVRICDYLSKNISDEIVVLKSSISTHTSSWPQSDTEIRRTLLQISGSTDPEDIRTKAAEFTDELQNQLKILKESLSADPTQIANQTLARKTRMDNLFTLIKNYAKEANDTAVSTLADLQKERAVATARLGDSITTDIGDKLLTGTGTLYWKSLYDAAKEFSNKEAYPDLIFPDAIEIQNCLLCQEPIDDITRQRLKSFRRFVESDAQSRVDDANEALNAIQNCLTELDSLSAAYTNAKSDLDELDAKLSSNLKEFCDLLSTRLSTMKTSLEESSVVELDNFPDSKPIISKIEDISTKLDVLEKQQRALVDEDTRSAAQSELDELVAKAWLADNVDKVIEYIDQVKMLESMTQCLADMKSAPITTISTKLAQHFVTDQFVNSFHSELAELQLRTIEPELHPVGGKKAKLHFRLRLKNSPDVNILDVASEGEQRCIALAAFLAELSQSSHKSALVFDDPVSSLDHTHRENIATRLAREASTRQVIVFTHDNVFLHELCEAADKLNISPTCRKIEWANNLPGTVTDGVPWDTMKPEDRIDSLQKSCRKLVREWQPQPSEANTREISNLYGDLRATIERIIERVVFGDTVFRYRNEVKTRNLHHALVFSKDHCDEIQRLHKICCDNTNAHDTPDGKQPTPPSPQDLMQHINDTNTVLHQIRELHKDQNNVRKAERKQPEH